MNTNQSYWTVLIAGIGMLLGLISVEIIGLETWETWATPPFIGKMLGHIAVVITAFIAGKLGNSPNRVP